MKLRIRGNSLRLRLTKSEAAEIGAGRIVEETVEFGVIPGQQFGYALVPSDCKQVTASFEEARIAIFVPYTEAASWAQSSRIGIEAEKLLDNNRALRILIEKDFACLEPRPGEEDADTFVNPLLVETEGQIILSTAS